MDCSARRRWTSADGAPARAEGRVEGVRWPAGDFRPRPARERARDRERDRAERRRQDDALQPRHRRLRPGGRGHPLRGGVDRRAAAEQDHAPGHRPHLPDAAPVFEHDGQGKRDGRRLRAHERGHRSLGAAHPRDAPRGARDRGARGGEALVLRPAPDGLPLGPAGVLALVRQSPTAGDRPRDGDQRAAAAARRAGRGHEPGRDARDHGADRKAPRGGWLHDLRDRARHAPGRGHLRPCRRPRPRDQDRRGLLRRGGDRPERGRGLPRPARGGGDEMTEAPANGKPLLEFEHVDTYYGQIHILNDVSLQVGAGELVCLLGGNASGKSTTLKTTLGIVRPRNGRVVFDGEDMAEHNTSYRIGRGMAIVPENRRLFAPMSVLENLEMGAYLRGAGAKEDFERVYSLFPLLYDRRRQLAGTLSGGEQQMVAMGRALMSRPKLLLMDEPSMGLAPILVERNFEIIQQVHESGVAILVVEQNANVSLSIADRGYVLQTGRVVLSGKASELLQHEDLRKAYLGR